MTDPMEQAWRNHLIRRHGHEIPDNKTPFRDALLNALGRIGDALERHADRAQVGIIDDPVTAFLNGGGSTKKDDPMLKHFIPGCDPREIPPSRITAPHSTSVTNTETATGDPRARDVYLTPDQAEALPDYSVVETIDDEREELRSWLHEDGAFCCLGDRGWIADPHNLPGRIRLVYRAPGPDELVIKRPAIHTDDLRDPAAAIEDHSFAASMVLRDAADAMEADR